MLHCFHHADSLVLLPSQYNEGERLLFCNVHKIEKQHLYFRNGDQDHPQSSLELLSTEEIVPVTPVRHIEPHCCEHHCKKNGFVSVSLHLLKAMHTHTHTHTQYDIHQHTQAHCFLTKPTHCSLLSVET